MLALLPAAVALAQDNAETEPPAEPQLASLQANWWTFFQGDEATVAPRVASFLEKKSPKHASLVKEGRLSAKDAYEEVVNRADRKDRKDPKCECPYCNSSIEHKTLLKIATLKPEEVNQMLTKLREGEMMDIAS